MTSSLTERLRATYGSSLRAPDARRLPPEPTYGSFLRTPDARRLPPEPPALPGEVVANEAGCCLVYEQRYPLTQLHGGVELGDCLELPHLAIQCLTRGAPLDEINLRQAVFLDTETTGLAGGTGTTAFLVGIGYFSSADACFVIKQFFMRDFAEERPMLLALAEALDPFRYVVSFNGKSYDFPLLETRYVLARLPRPRPPELHLDLLHPARRLWRERLGTCSLAMLEEAILGHRRESDVPSWAIPGLYVAYLQRGQTGPLRRVFSHNRHDLLSLASLASHLGRRLAEPLAGPLGADELLAVARLYEERGLRSEACACLEAAMERSGPALRTRLQLLLAQYCKRDGRSERALALWRELAAGAAPLTGLIELAKHHEHQQRDLAAAIETVEQALSVLELREARDGPWRWRRERLDLERRFARLARKRGMPRAS